MKNYGTKSEMLLIRSITNNSDNYDEKYMEIKLNSDDHLSLSKMLKLYKMIIVLRSVFHNDKKYYLQDFFRSMFV